MSEWYNPVSWDWSGLLGDSTGSNGGPKTELERMKEERASARRNAHFASLMRTMSEIGRQGQLTPYPERIAPIDLSRSQAAYNASMAQDTKYNELLRKQRSREAMMRGFGVRSGTPPGVPVAPVSEMAARAEFMDPRTPDLLYGNTPVDPGVSGFREFAQNQMLSWNDRPPPEIPRTPGNAALRAEPPKPRPEGMANALQLVPGWGQSRPMPIPPTIERTGGAVLGRATRAPPSDIAPTQRPQGGSAQVAPFLRSIPPAYHSFAQQLARHDPNKAMEFVSQVLSAQAKPRSAQWHNVIGTNATGDTIRRRVDTAGLRDLEKQGYTISADKPAPASVSVSTARPVATRFAEAAVKVSNEAQSAGVEARGTVQSVQRLSGILDSMIGEGVETGMGAGAKNWVKRFAVAAGWGKEAFAKAIASTEAFNAEAKKFILPLVKMLGVNPTDKDLAFIVEASPELAKSVAGNRFLLQVLERHAQRQIALAGFDTDFMEKNGQLLGGDMESVMGFRTQRQKALRAFIRTDPLWERVTIPDKVVSKIDTSNIPFN